MSPFGPTEPIFHEQSPVDETPSAAALAFTSGCLPWLSFLEEEGLGLVKLLLVSLERSS